METAKMVDVTDRVEDRVEVDAGSRVDVPQEFYAELRKLSTSLEDLEKTRKEIGRLTQVISQLSTACNNLENNARTTRQNLCENLGLNEGRWALDFSEKAFFRVVPGMPRVV